MSTFTYDDLTAPETTDCPVHSFIARNSYQCGEAECTCGGDVQAAHAAIPTRNYPADHRDECTLSDKLLGELPKPDSWILAMLDGEAIEAGRRIDRCFEALQDTREKVMYELSRGYISNEVDTAARAVRELLGTLESMRAEAAQRRAMRLSQGESKVL